MKAKTHNRSVISLQIDGGKFIMSKKAKMFLNVECGDRIMFKFNQKEKTVYIFKDSEDDAFKLYKKSKHTLRFFSRNLRDHFDETFNLLETNKDYANFEVSEMSNEKGLHEMKLIN